MDLGVLTLLSMTGWTLLRNSTASSARKPKLSNAEGILELKRMHNNDMIVSPRQDAVDEEGNDRLSSLPDDVIRKIFSFISIKDAIGTSVLSTRWRFMWTSMPCLKFEIQPRQSEFIDNVLSRRNNQLQVSSVDLVLERLVDDDESVARILDYTFSHNVQQLSVTRSRGNVLECPYSFIATPTWDLPFLTTLHLHCVQFSDDDDGLFSKCINLKNLFLRRCGMKGTKVMEICHPRLSNLTLQHTEFDEVVNVVAPQLKNLNITWCRGKHLVNAPGLSSLVIEGFQPWKLSTPSGFHSLDNVDLFMYDPDKADAHEIVSVFQHFNSVKLLILNLGILKCLFSQRKSLSSSMERIPYKAFTFANAKILKFLTKARIKLHLEVGTQEKVSKRTEITPIAIFPMISCEEMTAMGDMASAQIFVEQLELFVEQCKADTNSDKVPAMCKPQVEMHWALELGRNLKEMMAVLEHRKFVPLETCLIMLRIKREYSGRLEEGTLPIMAWLKDMRSLFERIEQLITQDMCASKRAVMLLFFLRMCEDAAILTGKMLGWINAQQKKPLII